MTSLTPKSKLSITTTNRTSFTKTTTIMHKKKTYQNEFDNQQTNRQQTQLQKHTFEKTQACKNHQYKMKI